MMEDRVEYVRISERMMAPHNEHLTKVETLIDSEDICMPNLPHSMKVFKSI